MRAKPHLPVAPRTRVGTRVLASVLALGLALSGTQLAAAAPGGAGFGRTKVAPYRAGEPTLVQGRLGFVTMVEFEPGERIDAMALGDGAAWQAQPGRDGTVLFLKPLILGGQTNLMVLTNRRTYGLLLDAAGKAANPAFRLKFAIEPPPPLTAPSQALQPAGNPTAGAGREAPTPPAGSGPPRKPGKPPKTPRPPAPAEAASHLAAAKAPGAPNPAPETAHKSVAQPASQPAPQPAPEPASQAPAPPAVAAGAAQSKPPKRTGARMKADRASVIPAPPVVAPGSPQPKVWLATDDGALPPRAAAVGQASGTEGEGQTASARTAGAASPVTKSPEAEPQRKAQRPSAQVAVKPSAPQTIAAAGEPPKSQVPPPAAKPQPAPDQAPPAMVAAPVWNGTYSLSGPRRARPKTVVDDGRFTYFGLRGQDQPPVIHAIEPDGAAVLVEARMRGPYWVALRLAARWRLTSGKDVVEIVNVRWGLDEPALPPPQRLGVVSPRAGEAERAP
jgi:type IV secretory pathway VirB9-like protein